MTVEETYWGAAPKTLGVAQLGTADRGYEDSGAVFTSGETYVFFVRAATIPGMYVVTGGDTAYRRSNGVLHRNDPRNAEATSARSALPGQVSEKDIASVMVRGS